MPTFFMYCRKSSEADRQILSIDSQISDLKQYSTGKGIEILEVLTEAKSAKAPGRPVFNSLMERLYRGEADGILCWKLDRLARNPVDGGSIIWAMNEQWRVNIITPISCPPLQRKLRKVAASEALFFSSQPELMMFFIERPYQIGKNGRGLSSHKVRINVPHSKAPACS